MTVLEISERLEHPRRRVLNDEVHARPPDGLHVPCRLSYVTHLTGRKDAAPTDQLERLLGRYGVSPPQESVKHLTAALDDMRLRWERHTEYSRYTLTRDGMGDPPFSDMPSSRLDRDWIADFDGQVFIAAHALVIRMPDWRDRLDEISKHYFGGNVLIGSAVADERGAALTDLRIHADGFSRVLLINESMGVQQAGRVMQRLLEIETYRMMTLLALPVAQQLTPDLDADEEELNRIGEALVSTGEQQALLQRLTRLAATSQHRQLSSNYRFSAADAYYDIVLQRIRELRETRIVGLQTFEEFTNRRLAPAVKTYRAASERQRSILEQMARATKLLSTSIDIDRQHQNQSLLASMNRRVKAQLRLQATVEGLSVAAVTYYICGLINLLAEGVADAGLPINPTIVTGTSIPVIAASVYLGVRRLRRSVRAEGGKE